MNSDCGFSNELIQQVTHTEEICDRVLCGYCLHLRQIELIVETVDM